MIEKKQLHIAFYIIILLTISACSNKIPQKQTLTYSLDNLTLASSKDGIYYTSLEQSSHKAKNFKSFEEFLLSLRMRESSNRYHIKNRYNYLGAYQLGEAALTDLGYYNPKKYGTFPSNKKKKNLWKGQFTGKNGLNSVDTLLKNPQLQEKIILEWLFTIDRYLQSRGLDSFIGMKIKETTITKAGMLAAAHRVGSRNLERALESKGKDKTINSKKALEYLKHFEKYKTPFETSIMDIELQGCYFQIAAYAGNNIKEKRILAERTLKSLTKIQSSKKRSKKSHNISLKIQRKYELVRITAIKRYPPENIWQHIEKNTKTIFTP